MTRSIVIAIGGTGAKLAEALIHLTAAGLGPDASSLFLIDQDSGNGNTARTVRVARAYAEARRLWRDTGQPHRVADDFLQPAIDLPDDPVWTPHRGDTLQTLLGPMDPGDEALFDLLFHREDEQRMGLAGGYRGRPNVGAAAMAAIVERSPFWRALTQALSPAAQGTPVRVLLMGSLFGGTGAAGFPTLARLIRDHAAAKKMGGQVAVGGVLMLPYFGFPPPGEDAAGDAANVARADELLIQSQGALAHYADLLARDPGLFRQIYLAGAEPLVQLAHHEPQGGDQTNPALFPELVAALGGARFLRGAPLADGPEVLATALHADAGVGWRDLPDDAAYARLGGLLRLAAAWRYFGPIAMRPRNLSMRFGLGLSAWEKAQGLGRGLPPTDDHAGALDAYFTPLLEWAAMIEAHGQNAGIRLWRMGDLLTAPIDTRGPPQRIPLDPLGDEGRYGRAFNGLIVQQEGRVPAPDTTAVYKNMETAGPADAAGLGRFLTALRRATAMEAA